MKDTGKHQIWERRNHSRSWKAQIWQNPCPVSHFVGREIPSCDGHSNCFGSPFWLIQQYLGRHQWSDFLLQTPLLLLAGRETLLEPQIPPLQAALEGCLWSEQNKTLFASLQTATSIRWFPTGQAWLGKSACRFRSPLRRWERTARGWIKNEGWPSLTLHIFWEKHGF